MSGKMRAGHPMYGLLPTEIEGFDSLAELALDMRWSWNHATDGLWRQLDPELWEDTHNPWVVLQTSSRDRIESVLADATFRKTVDDLVQTRRREIAEPAWFQRKHLDTKLTCAAYFSMEFMLSEALPVYSGGLGNVAGDQLKATSDLGVPVVGVGLLYQQGYFRQVIDRLSEGGVGQELFDPVARHSLQDDPRVVRAFPEIGVESSPQAIGGVVPRPAHVQRQFCQRVEALDLRR